MWQTTRLKAIVLAISFLGSISCAQSDTGSTAVQNLAEVPNREVTTPTITSEGTTVSVAAIGLDSLATLDTSAPKQTAIPDTSTSAPDVSSREDTESTSTKMTDVPTSVSTPEGVVYQVLKAGTGPVEHTTQTLLLHYTLYLPDGTKLESSREQEFPTPLKLRRNTDSFIRGFEIGTVGMRIGEIRKIYIPADLAYGEKGTEAVPPNTPLVFVTELVDLK